MELPAIGENCSANNCNCWDFLPIKCDFCKFIFCSNHNLPLKHNCQTYDEEYYQTRDKKVITKPLSYHCTLANCEGKELMPVVCNGCEKTFCLHHRHMLDHGCSAYVAPIYPMAKADEKIQQMASKMQARPPKQISKKNQKLAAKIGLMKLKGKSIGNKSLPLEERIYFNVVYPKSHGSKSCAVFISHHWSVGRSIDAIADLMKVVNRNNEANSSMLNLFSHANGECLGPLDVTVKELIEKEDIFNGQSVILENNERGTQFLGNYDQYPL